MPLARYVLPPKTYIRPPTPAELIGYDIKRCPKCAQRWRAYDVVPNLDGMERCPNCRDDVVTAIATAQRTENIYNSIEAFIPMPYESQMPVEMRTDFATVVGMANGNGMVVDAVSPLRMMRGVARALTLIGVHFSASDVITYPDGVTDAAPPIRTAMTVALSLVADISMLTGTYPLAYNDTVFRGVLLVR